MVNTARVQAGASVAVIGLGGVGLCSLLGAIAAGAREIVAIDLADDKLAFARQLGATATFNAKDPDCAEQVRSATGGGVEFAFELAGSVRALELAYKITRRGGTTVTAGLPPPTATMALPAVNLVAEERTLKGSYIGTAVPQPGHPALHPALPARPAAGRPADERDLDAGRDQPGLRPPARRHRHPPGRDPEIERNRPDRDSGRASSVAG